MLKVEAIGLNVLVGQETHRGRIADYYWIAIRSCSCLYRILMLSELPLHTKGTNVVVSVTIIVQPQWKPIILLGKYVNFVRYSGELLRVRIINVKF